MHCDPPNAAISSTRTIKKTAYLLVRDAHQLINLYQEGI